MNLRWLIFASALTTATLSTRSVSSTGTCASIGYSGQCCVLSQGNDCQATDGGCYCSADCHIFKDCCDDVYCPSGPRTCADIGITYCCYDASGSGLCDVFYNDPGNNYCSCNASCHDRGDCCPDVRCPANPRTCTDVGIRQCCNDSTDSGLCDVRFGDSANDYCSCNVSCHARNDCCSDATRFCIPKTCNDAGKYPKCTRRMAAWECYVPGGKCYCDPLCTLYNDCCVDAAQLTQSSSEETAHLSSNRLRSFQNHQSARVRGFRSREQNVQRQGGNINYAYQDTPVSRRDQRVFRNQREFKARPHFAG